jgi:hypothetical protein
MNWITIQTYTYSHEAHLDQMLLRNEGIETFLKDELTNSIDNFMSNAIGGVKLQVQHSDALRAREILSITLHEETIQETWPIISSIDRFSKKIPFIKSLSYEKRIFFGLVCFISVFVLLMSILYAIFL